MKGELKMNELELALLQYWKKEKVEWVYKYKHCVKEFVENPELHHHELFNDISSGSLFNDIPDLASYFYKEEKYPEDIKVHIDTLIEARIK